MKLTINEALVWQKTLKARYAELVSLRDANANTERRFYGQTDREVVKEPTYDVRVLDKMITRIAKELRLLEQAIKHQNGVTVVENYEQDDSVLGELL